MRTWRIPPTGEILQLSVGGAGALSPLVPPSLPAVKPRRLAMTPDGTSLYVTAGASGHGHVLQYDVSPTGLASAKDPAQIDAGELPTAIAVDPAGRTIYVTDKGACRVLQFKIGPGGRLEALGPLELPGFPTGVAVSPDGRSSYVIVGGSVRRYAIGADGQLDPASVSVVDTGGALTDVALTPDGANLYATSSDGSVFQFAVAADGTLSALAPTAVMAGGMPSALAIAPGGTSLYVAASSGTPAERRLIQYAIGTGGQLTALAPAGVVVPVGELRDLAVTPDGRSLYLAGSDLYLFDLASGRPGLAEDSTGPGSPRSGRGGCESQSGARGTLRDRPGAGRQRHHVRRFHCSRP